MKRYALAALCAAIAVLGLACGGAKSTNARKVAVFIPGVRAGSPVYEGLAKGVEKAVAELPGTELKILEAGFNQAEWEEKLMSLVATGEYGLVVTSNPSMPELCAKVGAKFPKQLFVCLDGYLEGNAKIRTVLYNQMEQGYVAGYLAGLVTTSAMSGATKAGKVGLVIGQHYPVMDQAIAPGFERGLKAVDPGLELDARVVGNWFDAAKAADLSRSMIESGVDLILPICGSASQGVIKTAQEAGRYVLLFDGDDYARAPGTVLGCLVLRQEELAYAEVKAALAGKAPYGKADVVGMKDGYVALLEDSPDYVAALPAEIRAKVAAQVAAIKSGSLSLPMPKF